MTVTNLGLIVLTPATYLFWIYIQRLQLNTVLVWPISVTLTYALVVRLLAHLWTWYFLEPSLLLTYVLVDCLLTLLWT